MYSLSTSLTFLMKLQPTELPPNVLNFTKIFFLLQILQHNQASHLPDFPSLRTCKKDYLHETMFSCPVFDEFLVYRSNCQKIKNHFHVLLCSLFPTITTQSNLTLISFIMTQPKCKLIVLVISSKWLIEIKDHKYISTNILDLIRLCIGCETNQLGDYTPTIHHTLNFHA